MSHTTEARTSAHDVIEGALSDVIPFEGIDDENGVTHTPCSLALAVERALRAAGHLNEEEK